MQEKPPRTIIEDPQSGKREQGKLRMLRILCLVITPIIVGDVALHPEYYSKHLEMNCFLIIIVSLDVLAIFHTVSESSRKTLTKGYDWYQVNDDD